MLLSLLVSLHGWERTTAEPAVKSVRPVDFTEAASPYCQVHFQKTETVPWTSPLPVRTVGMRHENPNRLWSPCFLSMQSPHIACSLLCSHLSRSVYIWVLAWIFFKCSKCFFLSWIRTKSQNLENICEPKNQLFPHFRSTKTPGFHFDFSPTFKKPFFQTN